VSRARFEYEPTSSACHVQRTTWSCAHAIRRRGNEIIRSEEKLSLLTTLLPFILYEVENLLKLGFDKRNQLTRDGVYCFNLLVSHSADVLFESLVDGVRDTCRGSPVGIAARLRPGQPGNSGSIPTRGKGLFSITSRPVLGPSGYRRLFPRGVKLTTPLHLLSTLRIRVLYLYSPIRLHGVFLK
jgi:hypothetical protein